MHCKEECMLLIRPSIIYVHCTANMLKSFFALRCYPTIGISMKLLLFVGVYLVVSTTKMCCTHFLSNRFRIYHIPFLLPECNACNIFPSIYNKLFQTMNIKKLYTDKSYTLHHYGIIPDYQQPHALFSESYHCTKLFKISKITN